MKKPPRGLGKGEERPIFNSKRLQMVSTRRRQKPKKSRQLGKEEEKNWKRGTLTYGEPGYYCIWRRKNT